YISVILFFLFIEHAFFGYPADYCLFCFALAIVSTFLGHSFFNWALKWLSTATISMGIVFDPVGASLLAYIILGEQITLSQWLGGTIVISGLFLFIMSTRKKANVTISRKKS